MSLCATCTCAAPEACSPLGTSRLLLATRVSHTESAVRTLARRAGFEVRASGGLLEVRGAGLSEFLQTASRELSSVEAAEVRAMLVDGPADENSMLRAALTAPTLATMGARVEHADLGQLFTNERDSFYSVYQPIISLRNDSVLAYEALLRARSGDEEIQPGALFGAAERAGWLHVLDRVGRTTALRDAGSWLGDDQLFINFIPTSIYRPQVCLKTTEDAALEAGLSLDQLVFEVTEGERISDVDHLAGVFAYYRERGCKVALDDLGSGYSSLNMLVRLQPDVVKIAKEITQGLPSTSAAAVVSAVVEITHSYGGQVLAECVETREQAEAATELGCDLAQGWYYGRPQRRTVEQGNQAGNEVGPSEPGPGGEPGHPSAPRARIDVPDQRRASIPQAVDVDGVPPELAVAPAAPAAASAAFAELTPSAWTVSDGRDLPTGFDPSQESGDEPGHEQLASLLEIAVAASASGVTISDVRRPDAPLVYVNPAFERMTGYTLEEVRGRNCRFLQGDESDREVTRALSAAIRVGREYTAVLRNHRADGTAWWNELHLSPVHNADGELTHYLGFQHDVTSRVEAERRLTHLAYHDQLTGLPNRTRLTEQLDLELLRARRTGRGVAVLYFDLDGFKDINDRHGHAAGDKVLVEAARRLRTSLRAGDLVARHGGDEFVAVLADVPAEHAEAAARRAVDVAVTSLNAPFEVDGQSITLGASVGVALFRTHGNSAVDLLVQADAAMYAAKAAGRATVCLAGT
ncbi:MAG TPA: EAL domain-containing protein [Frankiaceae bacterium]|nr:EAL domain-containing protein [Frankiaceae bacterium]